MAAQLPGIVRIAGYFKKCKDNYFNFFNSVIENNMSRFYLEEIMNEDEDR
jgi:hypothetical protein